MFDRPIIIGLSPNLIKQDVFIALKSLIKPWSWKKGSKLTELEKWFKKYFDIKSAISFNSGRSALLGILKSMELSENDEVLVQSFSCVAVANSIIWAGLKPVFVDIDNSLNIDVIDAQKKISPKTKVLIVQHTFGIPANMDEITVFCKKNNLLLIEDCAHALGGKFKNQLLGTFGNAAFFSFGRDKIISSIFGGMIISNDVKLAEKIITYHDKLKYPSNFWILQQLLHPIISSISLYLYNFYSIGKVILFLAQKLKLISFPVYQVEKQAGKPDCFPKKYPNVLAEIALSQINFLQDFNNKRLETAKYYLSKISNKKCILPKLNINAVYLRFNIFSKKAQQIRFKAKKTGIILGNWYENIIDPKGINMEKIGYIWGNCPNAEKFAGNCLNLPTYPNLQQTNIDKIVNLLNND